MMPWQLAGVAGLSLGQLERPRHKATLFGMCVPARFRQHGIGRQRVQAVLGCARARPGAQLVQLNVTEGNTSALARYENCGSVPSGVEPCAVAVDGGFVAWVHVWCNIRLSATDVARHQP